MPLRSTPAIRCTEQLSRAMQRMCTRISKRINAVMEATRDRTGRPLVRAAARDYAAPAMNHPRSPPWPLFAAFLSACASGSPALQKGTVAQRPDNFVSLAEVDPSIPVELRYFGSHNFMGRPVKGYKAEKCLLTKPAAQALKKVQEDLRPFGLSLKAYDCYRPQRAVDTFVAWAKDFSDDKMREEFYPRVPKDRIFREGYLLERSGHSRGSTIDLTVIGLPPQPQETYKDGDKLRDCGLPAGQRFADNTLDFGTGYDCFDALANVDNPSMNVDQKTKRIMLRALMEKHGFKPYPPEWWHFTLRDEPYPESFFDFEIE